jgi:DNA primase
VKQALARAESERRRAEAAAGQSSRHALSTSDGNRIAPRTPGTAERKEITGALVEWPVLLDDPECADELAHLEGESVKVVAALRRAWNSESKRLDTEAFLAQMEPTVDPRVRAFAAERLADPQTESETQAKVCLLENANKLKRLLLSQEAAQISRETYRAQGDSDAERELLRESQDRLRAKHGLKQ